jgi:anti-anti-sigma factor
MFQTEIADDTIRFIFEGELDSTACNASSSALLKSYEDFMKDLDCGYVVFDLTDVRYVSSAFLRICLYYCKKAGTRNFRIENPSTEVNRAFQVTGLNDVMTIV